MKTTYKPLPSWNDNTAQQAIINFIQGVEAHHQSVKEPTTEYGADNYEA